MQISRSVYTEVSPEDAVRGAAEVFGGSISPIGGTERESDRGRAFNAGSCAYDDRDTAEVFSFTGDRVHQGQERNPHGPGIWGEEAQFRRSALLGERILRLDSWPRRRSDTGIHQESGARGQATGSNEPVALTSHREVIQKNWGRVSDPT